MPSNNNTNKYKIQNYILLLFLGNTSPPISVVDLKSIITSNNETCDRKKKLKN